MRVRVKLFARLRDLAGAGDLACEIAPGARVSDVWQWLVERCPAAAPHGSSVSAAINAEYARMDAPVADGDEVAFLPPVSGGQHASHKAVVGSGLQPGTPGRHS